MPIVTQHPITVSYFISDIAAAMVTFDRMRWFRSRVGSDGPFEAATGVISGTATLLGTAREPHALNGKTLRFKVNGTTEVSVLFSGADPYTTAAVVADIAGATALVVASDENGYLRLTTVMTGSGASLEILESDAAPWLGFEAGDASVGTDADLPLVANTHEYFYTDQNSDETFWYRVQLYHSVTGDVSNYSVPLPAAGVPVVPASKTIVAYINLVDMTGRPIDGRRIILANVFLPNKVDQFGVFRHSAEMVTDKNGYSEIRLLRGMTLDVHVEGTTFTRRITLPALNSTATSVDLLDPTLVVEDEFGIQEPNIDFAIRMS